MVRRARGKSAKKKPNSSNARREGLPGHHDWITLAHNHPEIPQHVSDLHWCTTFAVSRDARGSLLGNVVFKPLLRGGGGAQPAPSIRAVVCDEP